MNFIDNHSDLDTINYMAKSVKPEVLKKALNHSNLVQKDVPYKTSTGKMAIRKQWVKAGEETSQPTQPVVKDSKQKRESVPATPFNLTENTKHLIPIGSLTEVPEHIKSLNIPPDWREVMVSIDLNPKSEILAIGKDSQNRPHYMYTQAHWDRVNAEKFQRVSGLIQKQKELAGAIKLMKNRDTADCLNLIYSMGIRPGSTKNTGAKEQAYGASTLLGKHVVTEGNKVYLRFIGKEGVSQDHEVTDRPLAEMLLKRKKDSGDEEQLFRDTNDIKLRTALKPLSIHPKDLRTMLANVTAKEWLSDVEPTEDVKEFLKIRNLVGDAVCSKLGNQRSMSLKSYIDPSVFENWSPKAYKKWTESQLQKKESKVNGEKIA